MVKVVNKFFKKEIDHLSVTNVHIWNTTQIYKKIWLCLGIIDIDNNWERYQSNCSDHSQKKVNRMSKKQSSEKRSLNRQSRLPASSFSSRDKFVKEIMTFNKSKDSSYLKSFFRSKISRKITLSRLSSFREVKILIIEPICHMMNNIISLTHF